VPPVDAIEEIERLGGRVVRVDRREDRAEPVRYVRYYIVAGAGGSAS
jgi:hypothetical protein